MTEKTTTEKATTEQSVDQLIREIVVSNDKGKKYEAASGQHWDKAWQMYIVAGIDLAKLKVLTGGGAPWMAAYTEKCGLKKSWVNTLISLGNGTTMVPQLRMQTAERVKKHRAKKAEQAKQEAKVTAGEAKATVTVTASDEPNLHTETEWKALRAKVKRIPELEARVFELVTEVARLEDIIVARDATIVDLRTHTEFDTAAPKKEKKAKKPTVDTDLPISASPGLVDADFPSGTHAGQAIFDSPQEAHNYRAEQPVDDPTDLFAKLAANKAKAKAAKKAAADAEQVAA
jgi:hypothetical protein